MGEIISLSSKRPYKPNQGVIDKLEAAQNDVKSGYTKMTAIVIFGITNEDKPRLTMSHHCENTDKRVILNALKQGVELYAKMYNLEV